MFGLVCLSFFLKKKDKLEKKTNELAAAHLAYTALRQEIEVFIQSFEKQAGEAAASNLLIPASQPASAPDAKAAPTSALPSAEDIPVGKGVEENVYVMAVDAEGDDAASVLDPASFNHELLFTHLEEKCGITIEESKRKLVAEDVATLLPILFKKKRLK